MLRAFDEFFEASIGIGLIECEVDLVLFVGELVFEGEEMVLF